MTNKTLLSIITICKNEPFIKSTCQSVCAQTNQNFEWLIIDGASTNNTLEQIEPFKNRANILISEQDNGIYPAMNKGINLASGKYLLFLNGSELQEYFPKEILYNSELPYLQALFTKQR